MLYRYYKDIDNEWKTKVISKTKQRMMDTRNNLIQKFGVEVANDCWYTKLDYISNWNYPDDMLFDICENCGCPSQLMNCISDKPGRYQSRNVVYKCLCGKYHHINA